MSVTVVGVGVGVPVGDVVGLDEGGIVGGWVFVGGEVPGEGVAVLKSGVGDGVISSGPGVTDA